MKSAGLLQGVQLSGPALHPRTERTGRAFGRLRLERGSNRTPHTRRTIQPRERAARCASLRLARSRAMNQFLTMLSLRPGISLEMSVHRLPRRW